jgi:hypothetical protein
MKYRLSAWKRLIMKSLTSAFLLASLTVPAEQPVADDKVEGAKPAAEVPHKKSKRRAVYQQFDEIPMRTVPPPVYAPQLTPRIDPTPVPPPVTINCVGAACTDGNGGSYRGGVGTSLISPQGRICNNNGLTVQCY